MHVERWDTFEIELAGSRTYDNPFFEVELTGRFTHAHSGKSITVNGFYDGDATWRLRFMPTEPGIWHYATSSADPGLNGKGGQITCVEPEKPYLRGPVSTRGHHFFHADGTPRLLLSTRLSCHWSSPDVWQEAIEYLKEHRINRVLFIMGGVHGTVSQLYGETPEGEAPDFWRYDLEKFRAIDTFIDTLRRADVLASPYFYYFNDRMQRGMTPQQDRAYLRYGMARFGAYGNVLPVLSNEVDQKFTDRRGQYDLASHTWANEMGNYLKELAVFGQAVTVHNPMETELATNPGFYSLLQDWPFPWTDYMLRQAQLAALSTAPELSDDIPEQKEPIYNRRGYARHNQLLIDLRRFGIPVVNEEPGYEMEGRTAFPKSTEVNLRPWNSQTADTLIPTFWTAIAAGGYVMWGNYATYWVDDPLPGIKKSATPRHLRILHDFITAIPYYEMEPANEAVSPAEVEVEGQPFRTNFCLAKPGEVYLVFSLNGSSLTVHLDPGNTYSVIQMDPRTGERTDLGQVEGGEPSFSVSGEEQVLLIQRQKG